jgi:hypothetical protein
MKMATNGQRYVIKKGKKESIYNIYVKEMIEMLKNEEVKENLYINGIKLSNHAFDRVKQHFGITNLATATRFIKDMLKNAKRIGTVLSYDGRINVMYAYNQTAILLSPDLRTVVTVNKYKNMTYSKIYEKFGIKAKENIDKDKLIELHLKYLEEIEEKEREQTKVLLDIEEKVREAKEFYQTILDVGRGKGRKKRVKKMISEFNYLLKKEGWKLFSIKVEKRYVCKSLSTLY